MMLGRALVSGTVAAAAVTLVASLAARRATGSSAAALNATSHFLWGDAAARRNAYSLKYTAVGGIGDVTGRKESPARGFHAGIDQEIALGIQRRGKVGQPALARARPVSEQQHDAIGLEASPVAQLQPQPRPGLLQPLDGALHGDAGKAGRLIGPQRIDQPRTRPRQS